jgi:hypothetical protein
MVEAKKKTHLEKKKEKNRKKISYDGGDACIYARSKKQIAAGEKQQWVSRGPSLSEGVVCGGPKVTAIVVLIPEA